MNRKLNTAKQKFFSEMSVLRAFSEAQAVLSWDRETHLPKLAASERGQTMSVLAGYQHQLFTDKKFVHAVQELIAQKSELSSIEVRSIELTWKELQKSLRVPQDFVESTSNLVNSAYHAWVDAKQKKSFVLFQPHLEKIIENRRQYAEYLNPDQDPYDALLDEYEEGLTSGFLQPLFAQLVDGVGEILPQVIAKQKQVSNPLNGVHLDKSQLESFLREMCQTIGFDWNRGAMGNVEHPFQISISSQDIRLNTHFSAQDNSFTVMGMIHELGHGLYEQHIDHKYRSVFLDRGVSLGIHESQSRFLENVIGRSKSFWQFFLPKLQQNFDQLKYVPLDQLVDALNFVQPSLIRTEADEVTYNLHIALRFQIEYQLMHQKAKVADLPEIWREKMKEMLQISVPDDQHGVLQDVHWAWGNIGYFPTYTLGNLNAAQLYFAFEKTHPSWRTEIASGNFASYFAWFKNAVWQHGSFSRPAEVMMSATGEKTDAKHFITYLKKKYLAK